jgi:hypothetical protein
MQSKLVTGRRELKVQRIAGGLALAGALALGAPVGAAARVLDVWVAAVPTWWNVAPNGHDAIMGMPADPGTAIFPTVVYQRYSPQWRRRLPNADRSSADGLSTRDR